MRTRSPDLRILPSSTAATFSFCATVARSTSLPLKKNAEVRAATRKPGVRASAFKISSEMPSLKYSFSAFPLMFTNGSTAMDLFASEAGAAAEANEAFVLPVPRPACEGRSDPDRFQK